MVDESVLAIETTNIMTEAPLVMGSNEYEMTELFRKVNVSRPVALTLVCLVKGREISSQNIEMVSGLRQPEVSIAMRYLLKNNWIEVREEKKSKSKGRPTKLYRLMVPMNQIISVMEGKIIAESRIVLINIEFLRKTNEISVDVN